MGLARLGGLPAIIVVMAFHACGAGEGRACAAQYYELAIAEPVSQCFLSQHPSKSITVAGTTYRGYVEACSSAAHACATWRIPEGWNAFECRCGVKDGEDPGTPSAVSFLLDGNVVACVSMSGGERARQVSFPIGAGESFEIRFSKWPGCVIEPRLIRGGAPPIGRPAGRTVRTGRYSLDPAGLDRLADCLYRQCETKPVVKEKVDKGRVAVSAFRTIGGCPKEVADSIAEDLSTAMIKKGFCLAERSQLDKVLCELKLQDTAMVNPATAQRIGQLSGCNLVLLGSISDQDSLVVINVRLMETTTGDSVIADRIELPKIYGASRAGDAVSLRSISKCAALAFWNLVASPHP